MNTDVPANAGPSARRYAKGEAKRREILDAALAVVAGHGYRNSTLQEIADAVELTKAGVLHYFDSREDLMAQVLRERDLLDGVAYTPADGDSLTQLRRTVEHNRSVPGLVQLYSRVVVEAESTEHPAHAYVFERYDNLVQSLAEGVRRRQEAGTARPDLDPVVAARMVIALSDGLQLQWLHDQSLDMSAVFDAAMALVLEPRAAGWSQ
ncbi:MAG: TetR/AcrR family transcriptional regulator [Cryobacterium sp.]|nr:TetR/AcrR family transcriptional regulator [Cryobacterium sp.]